MDFKNTQTFQNNFIFCIDYYGFELNDVLCFQFRMQPTFSKTLNIVILLIHYSSFL